MAHFHIARSWLAGPFPEVTPCIGPADWGAQQWLEHLAVDVAGIEEALIPDPTLEREVLSTGKRRRIRGIRNCGFSARLKMHGTGVATVVDSQVAETSLSKVLAHCMGGSHRTYTREILSGTTTVITFAADKTVGYVPGCLVAFEDTTAPADADEGKLHFRRVIAVDATTITLSEELPFTPAADDLAHGTITIHCDEAWLEDAVEEAGTASWLIKKTKLGTDYLWEVLGSVASFSIANLSRGQLPEVALAVLGANFKHSGEDGLTDPTPGTALGKPQLSMGIDAQMLLGVYGNDTLTRVDYNQAAFDVGFTRERVETGSENIDMFHGMSTYTVGVGDTKATLTLVPFSPAYYGYLENGTDLRWTLYQPGPGSGAGKAWALHMPRVQVSKTPGRADVNNVHASTVEISAMIADDATGGSLADLEKSPFLIGLA